MARIWMPGGGGADLDVVTASASNILTGKVIVDKDGNPLTGTMPDNTGTALTVATNGKTLIPKGYHDGTQYATNTQATMAGGTKTPTTSQQTISCKNKYMTSDIVIPAFSLPAASSIKKGVKVTIYGKSVTGTWEGYVSDKLYFFNSGTWSNLNTTGMNGATVSGGNIVIPNGDTARFNQTVNLTDYNYLKVTGKNSITYYSYILAGVGTTTSTYSKSDADTSTTEAGTVTVIVDISSLTGNYYIYIKGAGRTSPSGALMGGSGNTLISAIWLSKT